MLIGLLFGTVGQAQIARPGIFFHALQSCVPNRETNMQQIAFIGILQAIQGPPFCAVHSSHFWHRWLRTRYGDPNEARWKRSSSWHLGDIRRSHPVLTGHVALHVHGWDGSWYPCGRADVRHGGVRRVSDYVHDRGESRGWLPKSIDSTRRVQLSPAHDVCTHMS